MAILITTDGREINLDKVCFDEIRHAIKYGYWLRLDGINDKKMKDMKKLLIQTFNFSNNQRGIFDEEARIDHSDVNKNAMKYLLKFGDLRQTIFGNVVFVESDEEIGNF